MSRKTLKTILEAVITTLFSENFEQQFKADPRAFTRKKKLTFPITIILILRLLKKSLSVEILNILVQEFYNNNKGNVKLWRGFRLLSVDSSIIDLPRTKELLSYFGYSKNQHEPCSAQAKISVLYDLLNNLAIEGIMKPVNTNDRDFMADHLLHVRKGDLLVFDRGYPAFKLFYYLYLIGAEFVFRASSNFNKEVSEFLKINEIDKIVTLFPPKEIKNELPTGVSLRVRFVKIKLKSGETEILITSLIDKQQYPIGELKKLYNMRWGIETFYNELKNKLRIENFSGYSRIAIEQDFQASLFISNLQSLIALYSQKELLKKTRHRKYKYKINTNVSYGILKEKIIALFLSGNELIDEIISDIKKEFLLFLEPIRKNRSSPRNTQRCEKRRTKKTFINYREAI